MTEYIEVVPPRFAVAAHPGRVVTASRDLPLTGTGILAGTFPDGLTTIEGEPTTATVRVLYRPEPGAPGDGVVVAEVQSNQDGTWLVEGLNPELTYDVVGRKDGFNDVIMSRVRPYSSDFIHLSGSFTVVKPERNALEGRITVMGGTAPYTVDVVAGAAPAGIAFSYFYGAVEAAGTTEEWGDFEFTLRVTDSNGVWAETRIELESVDGQWDKVVSLLRFDRNLVDETGRAWSIDGAPFLDVGEGEGFLSIPETPISRLATPAPDFFLGSQDFTAELFVKRPPVMMTTALFSIWGMGSERKRSWGVRLISGDILTPPIGGKWVIQFCYSEDGNNAGYVYSSGLDDFTEESFHHLAIVRSQGDILIFFRGELLQRASIGAISFRSPSPSDPFVIGAETVNGCGASSFQIRNFRITKGVARYTEDFTPPKAQF